MPFEIDSTGAVVTQEVDGRKLPVFVHADGKKVPFDPDATLGTISRLNGEAKAHREAKEAAETRLSAFKDISDPAAALKALGIVKNLDDKKLVDAGEVDRVKADVVRSMDEKYKPVVDRANELEQALYSEKIGGSFSRSKLIADKFIIPADIAQKAFGQHFKIDAGRIVATDARGNTLYSRTRSGELADFDEALEMIVDDYPHKASILKGTGASGSGAQGSSGHGGGKVIKESEFNALKPKDRAQRMSDGYRIVA